MSERDLSEFPNDFIDTLRLSSQSPTPDPTFVSALERQLLQRQAGLHRAGRNRRKLIPNGSTVFPRLDWRYALVATIIALAVALMAIGPQRVLAEIYKLVGYIPGIGFVENPETALVLSQPITVTRDGVSMTVVNAIASSNNTRIILRADGLTGLGKSVRGPHPTESVALRLSQLDGSTIPLKDFSTRYIRPSSMYIEMDFQSLPNGVRQIVLSFSQIPGIPSGFAAPQDWQIPISFPKEGMNNHITTGDHLDRRSELINGLTLILSGIAQLDKSTALQLRLETNQPQISIEPNWWNNISIHDTNDRLIATNSEPIIGADRFTTVSLETPPLESGKTYILHLNGPIDLYQRFEQKAEGEFTFDPGPGAYIGKHWNMDKALAAGGYRFHLAGISLISNEAGNPALLFEIDSQDRMEGLMIFPADNQMVVDKVGIETVELREIPEKQMKFRLGGGFYQMGGDWQIPFTTGEELRTTPNP